MAQLTADGITTAHLDSVVHDAAAELATTANNDGLEAQVEFLLACPHWKPADILFQAREQRDEAAQEAEDAALEQRRDEKRGLYPDKIDPAN
jgi:hypothetical protein